MLKDNEGNLISIVALENHNISVLGKSGYGKTFWCNRYMEELACQKIPVLVLDFSDSYTEHELHRAGLSTAISIKRANPYEQVVYLPSGLTVLTVAEHFTDALINTIEISSIMQREIVQTICEELMQEERYISFKNLYCRLKQRWENSEEEFDKKNIDYLMRRIYPMRSMDNLKFIQGEFEVPQGIYLLQLSGFSKRIRTLYAQLVLELIWYQILQSGTGERIQIILDEWQALKVSGTAIECMIREGRKYGLGLVMLTQFISNSDHYNIIEQSAASLYFRPTDKNLIMIAKLIDFSNYKEWNKVLKNLERGEAVLCGGYIVNNRKKIISQPLVVTVVAPKE